MSQQNSSASNSAQYGASRSDSLFEKRVVDFQKSIHQVFDHLKRLDVRVSTIEKSFAHFDQAAVHDKLTKSKKKSKLRTNYADLFGFDTDEETQATSKARGERFVASKTKKSKKRGSIAKLNVTFNVKPLDDKTDMKAMEAAIRKIQADGLSWGAAKMVRVSHGQRRLQIACVLEDHKVSIFWLEEKLEAIENYIQNIDIVAFNKN